MTQWHEKARRKKTGGIRTARRRRNKRLAQKGGNPTHTEISDEERRSKKVGTGHTTKTMERRAKYASVVNPATQKTEKAEIVSVEKNDANRLFVRRNIITKGATLKVKIDGKEVEAKVKSRPGQQGQVQAVLVEKKAKPEAKAEPKEKGKAEPKEKGKNAEKK